MTFILILHRTADEDRSDRTAKDCPRAKTGAESIEVWGVVDIGTANDGSTECERVYPEDDIRPDFWSTYVHVGDGECQLIEDYTTRAEALAAAIDFHAHGVRRDWLTPKHITPGLPVRDYTRKEPTA